MNIDIKSLEIDEVQTIQKIKEYKLWFDNKHEQQNFIIDLS